MSSPYVPGLSLPGRRTCRAALTATFAILLTFGVTLGGLVAMTSAADAAPAPAAAPRITFGVQPATRDQFDSSRADFSYSATPGARINDYIAIRNYANEPVTVKTYAGDAFNTETGAYDILKANQKSKDLGAWLKLTRAGVTVPGRQFVIIPFSITLPAGAIPGDHDAGIVASIITQQLRSNGNRVSVEERVGARVHIRVSGPLRPELAVRNLKTTFHGTLNPVGRGFTTITYDVVNSGNVRLSAVQRVQVHAMIGGDKAAPALAKVPEILPGNKFKVSTKINGVWPGIRVKATVVLDPLASISSPVPGIKEVRQSASTWAVPWVLLGLIVVLVLLVVGSFWWRRRKAAAARAAELAPKEKQLVGAGVGSAAGKSKPGGSKAGGSKGGGSKGASRPIDLRDAPPIDIDAALDVRDPQDQDAIDLRETTQNNPDRENPPSTDPYRK